MDWKKCKVSDVKRFELSKVDTKPGSNTYQKDELKEELKEIFKEISKLQNKLFAENRQSLLILLQGMDSSGKDSAIKQIFKEVNPHGVAVHSFKHPSKLELDHDYLWRHAIKLPENGQITIFNRSHYENVLISKVHPELLMFERLPGIYNTRQVTDEFWEKRYCQINNFETGIIENGTQVLKFFLHLSKEEQAKRFIERIEKKEKHWKFSSSDITERKYWLEYQKAYEQAIKKTSTSIAPWFVIPADDKLCAHSLMAKIILDKLKEMSPVFPTVDKDENKMMQKAKLDLEKELKD